MPSPYIEFTDYLSRIAVADSQELKWIASVGYNSRGLDCPMWNLIGGLNSMRPIKEVADFRSIKGNEIVLTVDRPFGGPGAQGTTRLRGSIYEEKEHHATYRAKVGLMAKSFATDILSRIQTLIGSTADVRGRKKLTEWFKWQMSDEVWYELFMRAHSRNTLYAGGKTSRDQLTKFDYLDLSAVGRTADILAANQATPFDTRVDSKTGQLIRKYMVLGSHYAYRDLSESGSFIQLLAQARERGDKNELFGGGLPAWRNTLMHSFTMEDTTADGPIGGPGVARGRLGEAIAAGFVASGVAGTLKFGGNARRAALTTPLFAQHFSNAAFIGHEGQKVAADTTTERMIAIKNHIESSPGAGDAGRIGIYAYKVNDGNRLTITKSLRAAASNDGSIGAFTTIGGVTYNSGPWVTSKIAVAHPVGAEIYEVNTKGQPFVRSVGIANDMILSGYGSVEGAGIEQHGQRLLDTDDYGRVKGIGYQQVWGCRAIEDADNMPNGFVVIESAFTPDGWPDIVE